MAAADEMPSANLEGNQMIRFTRRTLIAVAAATVAATLSPLALAADTIKTGLVTALSGQSAQAGEALTRGMSTGIDESNA